MNSVTFIFDITVLLTNICCAYQGCFDDSVVHLRFVSMDATPTSDVISVTSVMSLSECVVECLRKDICEAFFYHLSIRNCSLHSQHVANITSTSGSGWIGYDFPDGVRPNSRTPLASTPTTGTTTPTTSTGTTTPTTSKGTTTPTTSTGTTTPTTTTGTTTPTTSTGTTTPITSTGTTTPTTSTGTTTPTTSTGTTTPTTSTGTTTPTTSTPSMTTVTTTSATTSTGTTTTTATSTTEATTPTTTTETTTPSTTPTTATTPSTTTSTTTTPTTTAVHQLWVESVVDYSSQWTQFSWSAKQIIGPSDVYPAYGDYEKAWASYYTKGIEWIEVQIAIPLYISQIDIYETYHAGGVREVSVWNTATSTWDVLWQTTEITDITDSRIFSPPIQTPAYKVDQIRIETDCSLVLDWVELDAVLVTGWT